MKGIFVLFAILALANCSTFLRNLAACTVDAIASATEQTCAADCAGTWDTSGTPVCKCADDTKFVAKVGCTKTCAGALASIIDHSICLGCAGTWDDSKQTGKCSCPTGKTFSEGKGCEASDPDPTPTPTVSCTIKTADAIKSVTNGTLCTDCGFKWDNSADAAKKCTCPDTDTDKAKIIDKTACETVCGYTWNTTASACSGMYIKIASALFGLLLLL